MNKPQKKFWLGKTGTISSILKVWKLPQTSRRFIRNILKAATSCVENNMPYLGLTNRNNNQGRPPVIFPGSIEEGIIADWMEDGLGFTFTTRMVNQHRKEEGLFPIGRSAVMNHFDKMKPIITKIQKSCQGNSDNERWMTARYKQCKQYLIMFQKISLPELISEFSPEPIPEYYDPRVLPKVCIDQVVWYDETHLQQEGGRVSRGGVQIRFPRDANGAFSPLLEHSEEVKYANRIQKPVFKYTKEARFCLGVGVIKNDEGEYVGKKTPAFSYTMKTVVGITKWNQLSNIEFKRVSNIKLKGKTSPWIVDTRPDDDVFYEEDSLMCLPGMGQTTLERIHECNPNIVTIKDLRTMNHDDIKHIRGINKFFDKANKAKEGSCPYSCVDHRKAANPYESRYGSDWETHLKQATALSPYVNIKDIILYMCDESQTLMEGTTHQDSWFFYHDALSLMTNKTTKDWMRQTMFRGKSIFSRWLVPQNNLQINTTYHERPVGNSPEFMPLDNSLNHDLKSSHLHHCAVTAHLPNNDLRKHSMSTPKLIERGILRIWNNPMGPPSSERIIHDCFLVLDAFDQVYKAKGAMVPGLCDRNGIRYNSKGTKQHGGARTKSYTITSDIWLEPMAASVFESKKEFIKSKYMLALEGET
jgi:hypothetical protein